MKRFWSVKGLLIVLILALVTLSSGTALASRQSAVSPQTSMERTDGASIVTNSICVKDGDVVTIYGSGWGSGELILLSVIRGANDPLIWYAGSVNEAGAAEIVGTVKAKPPKGTSAFVKYPGAGLYTLEALGTLGRLATYPILFVEDKCPGEA